MFLKSRPRYAKPLAQRLDRRKFGQALGAGLIAAPFVRLLLSEPAQAAPGSAKRVVFMVTGGTHLDNWRMVGSTDEMLVTNTWNDGIERVKDNCVVVENLDAGTGGHTRMNALLTTLNRGKGDSIDRIVSDYFVGSGVATPIPSLLLGSDVTDRPCFRHAGGVLPVQSPTAASELVFGGFIPDGEEVDEAALAAVLARKQSMLDSVRADLNELHGMLGTEERPKLQKHLDSLRQYELRLTQDAPNLGAGCEPPTISDSTDAVTVAKSHMLLARATLACDISRVVGVSWGQDNQFDINLPEIDVVGNEHGLHHPGARKGFDPLGRWENYVSHQFADFVELLRDTPDPESGDSLLDSTLFCWARHMGDAPNHSCTDSRLVFAGGPNILRTTANGRYIDAGGADYRSGLTCVAHAVGQTDQGAVDGNTPLSNVLA